MSETLEQYQRRQAFLATEPHIKATRAHMYNLHYRCGYHFRGQSDHAEKVLERFFRRKRFTCVDLEEYREVFRLVWCGRLRFKHHCAGSWYEPDKMMQRREYWVDGQAVDLNKDNRRHIARLHAVTEKLSKLDALLLAPKRTAALAANEI